MPRIPRRLSEKGKKIRERLRRKIPSGFLSSPLHMMAKSNIRKTLTMGKA